MNNKHTPGPWLVGSEVAGQGWRLFSDKANRSVAWVEQCPPGSPDARLIVAAPALWDFWQAWEWHSACPTAKTWAGLERAAEDTRAAISRGD
jgi:hypothetical protein